MGEEFPQDEIDSAARRLAGEEYDHLFTEDTPEEPLDKSKWPALSPRQQRAFAPFLTDKKESEKTWPDRRIESLRKPNAESMAQAAERVIPRLYDTADPVLLRIMQEHLDKSASSEEILLAVQSNQDLREELARYLLAKVSDLTNMKYLPERVATRTGKNSNGNADINDSHEQAVALALAILDGSFKYGYSPDPVIRDESGRVKFGQHRAAAEFLIGLPTGTVE